jgi:hypothetical protein
MNNLITDLSNHKTHNLIKTDKAMRNYQKALQLEEDLFYCRSRYLILILTLGYKPEYRSEITPEIIARHRDKLLHSKYFNPAMVNIDGYVWTVEYGDGDKFKGAANGYHIHLVLWHNGLYKCDINKCDAIGEYWNKIVTDGKGSYWNSNNTWKNRKKAPWFGNMVRCTGQIDRKDTEKRNQLRWYLGYLAKDMQQIEGAKKHYRTFGTSQTPMRGNITVKTTVETGWDWCELDYTGVI